MMEEAEMEHALDACEYWKSEYMREREGYEWKRVTFNPYKYKTFVTVEDEQPVMTARKVIIGKEVWAMIPTNETHERN